MIHYKEPKEKLMNEFRDDYFKGTINTAGLEHGIIDFVHES